MHGLIANHADAAAAKPPETTHDVSSPRRVVLEKVTVVENRSDDDPHVVGNVGTLRH